MKAESASLLLPLNPTANPPPAPVARPARNLGATPTAPALRQTESRPTCRMESSADETASTARPGRRYFWALAAWFIGALALTLGGVLTLLPMPFPQVLVATATVTLLVSFGRGAAFRQWILDLPIRALLIPHAVRLVGGWFIFLHFRSELPYAFAIPAGVGDLAAVATAAAVVWMPSQRAWGRVAWLTWNTFSLLDILFVVATAARIGIGDPASMAALVRFPLGLLPAFFVPLILFTHIALYVRLIGRRANSVGI